MLYLHNLFGSSGKKNDFARGFSKSKQKKEGRERKQLQRLKSWRRQEWIQKLWRKQEKRVRDEIQKEIG